MILGPYQLLAPIGRGGSGVVHRAVGPDGGIVAVKVLDLTSSGEAFQRFARERRLLGALGSAEGIVPFLDSGEVSGRPYVVMPLLTGGTLRDRIRRGRLTVDETIAHGVRLARALGHAHALGVVHRDVKPENVLFDHTGRCFLADLGLAKHFRRDVKGASQSYEVSRPDGLHGTFGYMPPEQLHGQAVGPPADVFALGAVLHECLAGSPAFPGENAVEIANAVLEGRVAPLAKLRPETPPWLVRVVERALAPRPPERFADGVALAAALESGARAAPGGSRRVRAVLLGVAPVLVAGVAVAIFTGRPGGSPAHPSAPAPAPPRPPATATAPTSTRAPADEGLSLPRRWALAAGAVFSWRRDRKDEVLGGCPITPQVLDEDRAALASSWRVTGREALIHQLRWCRDRGDSERYRDAVRAFVADPAARALAEGRRSGPPAEVDQLRFVLENRERIGTRDLAAWDLSRVIALAGRGYHLGWLTEDEAWAWSGVAARRLQATYASWEEFAEHFNLGVRFWKHSDASSLAPEKLLSDPGSPWRRYAWRTDLSAGPPWPPEPD